MNCKTCHLVFFLIAATNCKELRDRGAPSGIYSFNPDGQGTFLAYCDQTTDGGGWVVFQRCSHPFGMSFNRNWAAYQQGFGDMNGEFWLGNDKIHRLTSTATTEFRIDLTASGPSYGHAKFSNFQVHNNANKYWWSMNSYSGNIGNAMYGSETQAWNQNNMRFSTPDQDNDNNPGGSCAASSMAGWWCNWYGYAVLQFSLS